MATKKKRSVPPPAKKAAKPSTPLGEGQAPAAAGISLKLKVMLAILFTCAGAVVARIAWMRSKDPSRLWIRAIEAQREPKLQAPFQRCFGAYSPQTVRAAESALRQGQWPEPFKRCAGPVLSETEISVMTFSDEFRDPPRAVQAAKDREKAQLEKLRLTLHRIVAVAALPRDQAIPDVERDRLLNLFEDLAADVEAEKRSFNDLVEAAEDASP